MCLEEYEEDVVHMVLTCKKWQFEPSHGSLKHEMTVCVGVLLGVGSLVDCPPGRIYLDHSSLQGAIEAYACIMAPAGAFVLA